MRSPFAANALASHTVLVTGAGSGIGREISITLNSAGARVLLLGRTREHLLETQGLLSASSESDVFVCDLKSGTQRTETFKKIVDQTPRLLGVVNNAGGQFISPLEEISLNGLASVMELNFTAPFHLSQMFFQHYGKKQGGKLIHVLADCEKGMPYMGHSGAARAALKNFTLTSAVEWGRYHVHSNAIAPGYIHSSGLEKYPKEAQSIIEKLPSSVPLGRLGTTLEIANAVMFLLTSASDYINGEILKVDGGSSLMFGPWNLPEVKL